jgi:cellulose biosynthesis protein BcsQ
MAPVDRDWEGVRLHVVTGKGGTGKTTVAAALALALAAGGRQVLLVEVEGRQGLAQLFDVPPLPYEERKVAVARDGGDVFALAVDAEQALLEYLEMFYKLGRAGKGLKRIGAVDFATTVAPGLRDVLLTGKVYEAVGRRRSGRRVYDAVVMDAPPTGRIARFLNVNSEVAGLARVGPVRTQADSIMRLLRSPESVVHFVTLLEEMPVQETCDGVAEVRALGLPVGGVVVNMVRTPLLRQTDLTAAAKGRLDAGAVTTGLKRAGLEATDTLVDGLLTEAREHAQRVALEKRERKTLAGLGVPTYELPLVGAGVDLGVLYAMAERLAAQGAS